MTHTPTRHGARAARAAFAAAPIVGLLLSALLVWQASYAAFRSDTTNPGNSWQAGALGLTDNDAESALFSESGLVPGSTRTRCIAVTSNGTVPSTVKLYGSGHSTTKGLSTYLDLVVTQGTTTSTISGGNCGDFTALGAGSGVFSGTLAGFAASTSFDSGLGTWTPTGSASETRVFQLTYTLRSSAPDSTQGGSSTIAFTWESRTA